MGIHPTLLRRDVRYTGIINTAVLKVTVLYTAGLLNTVRSILRKSLHVDEISSRSSAYVKTPT